MFSALVISNAIIFKAMQDKKLLTPLQLQKMLFFVYGEYYAKHDKKLFEEPFLVWRLGPVVQSVYEEFRGFGAQQIFTYAKDALGKANIPSPENIDFYSCLDAIWARYKNYTGYSLVQKTHEDGMPWSEARKKNLGIIPDNFIKSYFRGNDG